MANYNIEEVQKIVGILIDADAVMCVPHFAPQRYFSNMLYEIPMGYTITVNFENPDRVILYKVIIYVIC